MYLGIDQSLNATGLCLVDVQGQVQCSSTVDPGKSRGVERLAFIKDKVSLLLRDVLFVSFEGYSYDSVGRVFELGEVGGVLHLTVFEHGIQYIIVAPAALKKFATGNATAEKEEMVEAARLAGFDATDDNQADAFFLSQIARHFHLGLIPNTREKLEILHSFRHPRPKKPTRRLRRLIKNGV